MTRYLDTFGIRQRCLKATDTLYQLLLTAIHYDRDINFYIYEGDDNFLGIINRDILLERNLSAEECSKLKLGDICQADAPEIIIWESNEFVADRIQNVFLHNRIDEVVIVKKETSQLIDIITRTDFCNEAFTIPAQNDDQAILYRNISHYYKPYTSNLNKYANNINSQHGEDGILKRLFEIIGFSSKFAVEFGGWDGIYLSNIRNLIIEQNFSAIFIEGDTLKAKDLINNYKQYPNVICVEAYVGFKENTRLDDILLANNAPTPIDIISIDIDGYDYHVWDSLQKYKPRVIIIEYNPTIPNDIVFIPPYSEHILKGASATALVALGRKKGYSLVAVTQTNLIFIIEEEYNKLGIYDNDLNVLRPVDRLSDGKYFQTFDKEIVLTGVNSYLWANEAFNRESPITFSNI